MTKRSFGMIEVLVSVMILVVTGVAIITLNTASLRLSNNAETKTTAYNLVQLAINYFKFKTPNNTENGYLYCPVISSSSSSCSTSTSPKNISLGNNYQIKYSYNITDKKLGITVSWNDSDSPKNSLTVNTILP